MAGEGAIYSMKAVLEIGKKHVLRKTGRVDSACANKLHTLQGSQGLDYVIVSLHRGIVGLQCGVVPACLPAGRNGQKGG